MATFDTNIVKVTAVYLGGDSETKDITCTHVEIEDGDVDVVVGADGQSTRVVRAQRLVIFEGNNPITPDISPTQVQFVDSESKHHVYTVSRLDGTAFIL